MSRSSISNRVIIGMLIVAALATGFWILLLSPKRQQADELAGEVEAQQTALLQAQSKLNQATAAQRAFPADYRQLVTLGKAVPAGDETASLLVELNRVADRAGVRFDSLQLNSSEGSAAAATPVAPQVGPNAAASASTAVPPTEAEAALLPLGATVGSAGLGVMPYDLTFTGSFFHVADFIHGIDSLVHTRGSKVGVDGRLVTLNAFSLTRGSGADLSANFSVTTYLLPPSQGLTAGASSASPATETGTGMQLSSATTAATPTTESSTGESTEAPK